MGKHKSTYNRQAKEVPSKGNYHDLQNSDTPPKITILHIYCGRYERLFQDIPLIEYTIPPALLSSSVLVTKSPGLLIGPKLLHAAASENIAHDDFCMGIFVADMIFVKSFTHAYTLTFRNLPEKNA